MYLIVLSAPPPAKKDKRRAEMFMSRQQSWGRVLWPDARKLASRGRRRGRSRMCAAGCEGTIIQARLKKKKTPAHTHTRRSLCEQSMGSQMGVGGGLSDTNKCLAEEGGCFPLILLLVLSETGGHGVLPSSSPLGCSLETSAGEKKRSEGKFEAKKYVFHANLCLCNKQAIFHLGDERKQQVAVAPWVKYWNNFYLSAAGSCHFFSFYSLSPPMLYFNYSLTLNALFY